MSYFALMASSVLVIQQYALNKVSECNTHRTRLSSAWGHLPPLNVVDGAAVGMGTQMPLRMSVPGTLLWL